MVYLLDSVQFSFGILNTIGVTEGVLEDLNQGSQVWEVHGVILHIGGDLIEGVVLQTVDGATELLCDSGEGSGL
jgi:hypothetical protein